MFPVDRLRRQFPVLHRPRDGRTPIFLDGPGGTQVPQRVIDAMVRYLSTCNANHGGVFATSRESDRIIHEAHAAVAELINAPSAEEVIFGANMTTLTFHLSRAIARTLKPGDEILVSRLDHDANVRPWLLAARDAGAEVRWIEIHPEDCTLDLESLRRQLGSGTRLVAVAVASNAVGTINDVTTITRWAHEAGARVFVDAVHFAPHGPIDVQAWNCDFLTFSVYKVFGPHVGVLWGRRELLHELPAYKLEPAGDSLPDRWMTGTQNHEGLAGVTAALDYLADIGADAATSEPPLPGDLPRTQRHVHLRSALSAIQQYERDLASHLLQGLRERPRFRVWGLSDPDRSSERVPTIAITHPKRDARALAEHLAARHIYAWHGNMYALELTRRLGLEDCGGFLRLGLVHYNTHAEIDATLNALDDVA